MSFFSPDVEAVRLWIALLGIAPFWQFVHDIWGRYVETFRHYDLIQTWTSIFPLLYIKFIAVAAYGYGRHRDSRPVNADIVIVTGKKQSYVVQLDRDKKSRELRMGILGQPEADNVTSEAAMHVSADPSPKKPRIAVVCPVYLSDVESDRLALKRLHERLRTQDRQPDLIVLVDDCSPGLARAADDVNPRRKPGSMNGNSSHPSSAFSRNDLQEDPYAFLDLQKSPIRTKVVRIPENLGPAGARNAGIDHAIAELGHDPARTILFLTDLDCLPPSDWIVNGYQAVISRRPSMEMRDGKTLDPLVVGGITSSAADTPSMYAYYHDFYGALNPRVWIPTSPTPTDIHPLYAPSCNLVVYPGDPRSGKQLPKFHEGFREPSMEKDVLFCLEAVFRRGCELAFDKVSLSLRITADCRSEGRTCGCDMFIGKASKKRGIRSERYVAFSSTAVGCGRQD
jgi:hypothetical protein